MHTDPDGAMAHVRPTGLRDGIVVDINDAVEVVRHDFRDVVEFLEIVDAINDEGGESKKGKVADGCFVWGRVFYDCGAKI